MTTTELTDPDRSLRVVPDDAAPGSLTADLPQGCSIGTVLDYLRTAPVVYSVPSPTGDRRDQPLQQRFFAWFTDGVWLWSSAVVVRAERYQMSLPAEFLLRIQEYKDPPAVDTDTLLAAAREARSLHAAVPQVPQLGYLDHILRRELSNIIEAARRRERASVSGTWRTLQDTDPSLRTLESLVRGVWMCLRPLSPLADDFLVEELSSPPGPLYPAGPEMVGEVLKWVSGSPLEGHMDTSTRIFYSIILVARLIDVFAAKGVPIPAGEMPIDVNPIGS